MKRIWTGSAIAIIFFLLIGISYLRFSIIKYDTESKDVVKFQRSALLSTSGTFIIPVGEKEVNRNTTGKRVAYYNVGDRITVLSDNPEALYYIDDDESRIKIDPYQTVLRVVSLGNKNYLRFVNHGNSAVKIKVRVTPC